MSRMLKIAALALGLGAAAPLSAQQPARRPLPPAGAWLAPRPADFWLARRPARAWMARAPRHYARMQVRRGVRHRVHRAHHRPAWRRVGGFGWRRI